MSRKSPKRSPARRLLKKSRRVPKRSPARKIMILNKGTLTTHGYNVSKSSEERHRSLRRAAQMYGPITVMKKLNAVCVLTRNRSPSKSKIFCNDKKWVQENLY